MVRIWDLATGAPVCAVPTHHEPFALTWLADQTLAVGLAAGLLALALGEGDDGRASHMNGDRPEC